MKGRREQQILGVYLNKATMPLSLRLHSFICVSLPKFIDTDLTLLRHFLKRAIQDMCCSCKWGLFWQDPRTWGSERGGERIPGPTFQGLVVVFPVENAVKKKKEFCANRASGHQRNCDFPFRFCFHVRGMVWIIVPSVICPFHGC